MVIDEQSPQEPTQASSDLPAIPVLTEPRDGVPPVIESRYELVTAAELLAAGTGPLAIDAERASGYRYGQRAYLIQVRREGSGDSGLERCAQRPVAQRLEADLHCEAKHTLQACSTLGKGFDGNQHAQPAQRCGRYMLHTSSSSRAPLL